MLWASAKKNGNFAVTRPDKTLVNPEGRSERRAKKDVAIIEKSALNVMPEQD